MRFWKVRELVKGLLERVDALEIVRKHLRKHRCHLKFPPYDPRLHAQVVESIDPVRYGAIALAIHTLRAEGVPGALAEVGVYRGETSRVIHLLAPERKLYLFDTFEGFGAVDPRDPRFQGTGVATVQRAVGDLHNVVLRKGIFPGTTAGLEDETFAFVMLDVDKYAPTKEGLTFFYPRLSPGGYVFLHDYTSPESQHAVSRATGEFLADKIEKVVQLPDYGGSAVFRKL